MRVGRSQWMVAFSVLLASVSMTAPATAQEDAVGARRPNWRAESNDSGALFGYSVASAGDVNGDGYRDVIAGAPLYSGGLYHEGGAFVYTGSPWGLQRAPSWTAQGGEIYASIAWSVASAGDVNADGYDDVLVGAPGRNDQGTTGWVYLYLGSASGPASTPSWSVTGGVGYWLFGTSVASAGDVNADGYDDVLVGASWENHGQEYEGRAYLYLGSASGPGSTAAWTAESDQAWAEFGTSVASAGDVNGDGYDDVIVGAPKYSNGQDDEGRAYLYLGSPTGLGSLATWTAEADQASAYFGISVASAGDVNGDGYDDAVVGASLYSNGQSDEGRAYAFMGSPSGLSATPAWGAESNQEAATFGSSVASAGDVNGDGYGDVIVGAPWLNSMQGRGGRSYVYIGSENGLSAQAWWMADANQPNAFFGFSVASAGDVNGDGNDDIVVGAPDYHHSEPSEGMAAAWWLTAHGSEVQG